MGKPRLLYKILNSRDRQSITNHIKSDCFPQFKVDGIGNKGIDDLAADILDLGSTIFLIERLLPGRQHVNRTIQISVELGMRQPDVWTKKALKSLQDVLYFMGGINWEFKFFSIKNAKMPRVISTDSEDIDQIALFSGGLDSLCGAATLCEEHNTRLVSYYKRQMNLQKYLAAGLEMKNPVQWAFTSGIFSGKGTNYFYRSFMFLCLAAVTARSFGASNILQFENGILACGITPSLNGRSTKHAHYLVHKYCQNIFNEVFGEGWTISNPFMLKTKQEAFNEMVTRLGINKANELAAKTESCWHLYAGYKDSNLGKKSNGIPCGFCVPCLIRETAHQQNNWVDLRLDANRNHSIYGHFFREFCLMLKNIQNVKNGSIGEFYLALGSTLHNTIKPAGAYEISELKDLFLRFASEFMLTYKVK